MENLSLKSNFGKLLLYVANHVSMRFYPSAFATLWPLSVFAYKRTIRRESRLPDVLVASVR